MRRQASIRNGIGSALSRDLRVADEGAGELIDPARIPPGFQLRSGYTSQARFVEFKMPWQEPERYAGTWRAVIQHKGLVCFGSPEQSKEPGFLPRECKDDVRDPVLYGIAIGVGSNFRMQPFVSPAPVYVGEPIRLTALVSEAGLPVTGCSVEVEATAPDGSAWNLALRDDGAHDDGEADDGEYATTFGHTGAPGIYHFKFRAVGMSHEGKTVIREAVRDKPVLGRGRPAVEEPIGRPSSGKPLDGERPPQTDDCCQELRDGVRGQTRLLQELLKAQVGRKPK